LQAIAESAVITPLTCLHAEKGSDHYRGPAFIQPIRVQFKKFLKSSDWLNKARLPK